MANLGSATKAMPHQAFYETIAAIIPILLLALIVENRVRALDESDRESLRRMAIVTAGLLVLAEVVVLKTLYDGKPTRDTAMIASGATGMGVLLLLFGSTLVDLKELRESPRAKLGRYGLSMLIVVLFVVLAVIYAYR